MNHVPLYPLKFKPILNERLWGGTKLYKQLGKPTSSKTIGESWEISAVEGYPSIVSNGKLKGNSLQQLLHNYGSELIGKTNSKLFGNTFPLLIKFIDAKKDLSVQLHPNDTLAKQRHNSFGKTEMWYVMQADTGSKLIVDFNQPINKTKYLEYLNSNRLTEILNFETVKKGDAFFIESGRVHAIGAGILLAEIQQTSNITYRIYDWDRVDANGNPRELHTDLAIDAINFEMEKDFKMNYATHENRVNPMVSCPYFTTNYLNITNSVKKKNTHDSFIIYICVNGNAELQYGSQTETLDVGETLLLPASVKDFQLISKDAELLEVYV